MRRGVSHVDKEGVVAFVFLDVSHGMVADGVGVIIFVGLVALVSQWRHLRVFARERIGIKETARTVDRAVKAIEAALAWPVVFRPFRFHVRRHVPFARHVGGVSGGLEHLGDGADILPEVAFVPRQTLVAHHPTNACLMRIHAGEQRGPRGAAAAGVVKLREAHALVRQRIQPRRANLAAVATNIAPTHVIGHGDNDVGAGCIGCLSPVHGQTKAGEEMKDPVHLGTLPKAQPGFKLHWSGQMPRRSVGFPRTMKVRIEYCAA